MKDKKYLEHEDKQGKGLFLTINYCPSLFLSCNDKTKKNFIYEAFKHQQLTLNMKNVKNIFACQFNNVYTFITNRITKYLLPIVL